MPPSDSAPGSHHPLQAEEFELVDQVRAALAKRFILLAGEKDTDGNAPDLNRSSGAMRQGANRLERAETFFKAATAAAQDLGIKFIWEYQEVPGVAHDGAAMSKAAAALIGKK